jgi:hypothetical protein
MRGAQPVAHRVKWVTPRSFESLPGGLHSVPFPGSGRFPKRAGSVVADL